MFIVLAVVVVMVMMTVLVMVMMTVVAVIVVVVVVTMMTMMTMMTIIITMFFAAAAFNRTIIWVTSPLSRLCLPFYSSGYGIMGAMAAGDAFQETLTLPSMCPQLREQESFAPDGWKAGRNNW